MIRSRSRRERCCCCCCSSRTDARVVLSLTPPEIPKQQLFSSCSLFPLFLSVCFYKIYKNTVLVRDVLCALDSSRCESCASLKREGYICCFHGDIFAPKNGWFREKHKIRTIKFLFASSTLCLLLSFPHYSKCFFVVLLVALQFYYPSEKEATRVIPFCRALLRGKRREGSRESCTSKVHIIRVERLTLASHRENSD